MWDLDQEGAVEYAKAHLERCRNTMSFPSSLLESYAKAFKAKQPREAVRILYSACDYAGVVRILVRLSNEKVPRNTLSKQRCAL